MSVLRVWTSAVEESVRTAQDPTAVPAWKVSGYLPITPAALVRGGIPQTLGCVIAKRSSSLDPSFGVVSSRVLV